jgi:hypothetical protein
MKVYRRLVRRRVEGALRLRLKDTGRPEPIEDDPLEHVPVEVIDLETGPFEARFPDMSRGRGSRDK